MEHKKEYDKQYYHDHKDKRLEYVKKYQELNKDKINEKRRDKYLNNEEWRLKENERQRKFKEENRNMMVKCECGAKLMKFSLFAHKQTKKHEKLLNLCS